MVPKIREISMESGIAFVPLTRGMFAIIDASDAPLVQKFNWYALPNRRSIYAATTIRNVDGGRRTLTMHALITGFRISDHIDGDGLNNKRSNLREVSAQENSQNSRMRIDNRSGVKGVSWYQSSRKWQARVALNGVDMHLGYFADIEDARVAVESARSKFHGDFARNA